MTLRIIDGADRPSYPPESERPMKDSTQRTVSVKAGAWIRSPYGAIGILNDPPVVGDRVNARHAYDGAGWWNNGRKAGDPMQTLAHFVAIVPDGTLEGDYADFPTY